MTEDIVRQTIYLDHNSTTPCNDQVIQAMLPWFGATYGNPSNGLHYMGRMAARAVEDARTQIASLIDCIEREIVFTSGATESNNLAIQGVARWATNGGSQRRHIITSAIEHKSVLAPIHLLASQGYEVTVLPVDTEGRVLPESLRAVVNSDALLVSIHAANNEIGTLQLITELSKIAHQVGAFFHTDAAQAVGKIPVNTRKWDVDLLSFSSHKLYGPKGVGGLYVSSQMRYKGIEPLSIGGGQEGGLRPGTLNVPGIVGTGEACKIARERMAQDIEQIRTLRDMLENALASQIPLTCVNGRQADRLPGTSSVTIPGVDADALLLSLPYIAMATGSACTTGAVEPSHVLEAMGLSRDLAHSTIRISIGRSTTDKDIRECVSELQRVSAQHLDM